MGIFDSAKGAIYGNRAYRAHVDAGKLANDGQVKQAGEKYREALGLYEKAEQLGNVSPNILLAYALLLMREGAFDRSKELMHKINRIDHLSDEDRFQLRQYYSILLWRTGHLDEAIETIERAAAYKVNGSIYGTLGMYLVDKAKETGIFEEALAYNRQAMDYDDEDAATLDNMGQLYEAMSRSPSMRENAVEYRAQARQYYEKAHEVRPRQITTIYCLAHMAHEDGDDTRAAEFLTGLDTLYFSAICPITRAMMDELADEIRSDRG